MTKVCLTLKMTIRFPYFCEMFTAFLFLTSTVRHDICLSIWGEGYGTSWLDRFGEYPPAAAWWAGGELCTQQSTVANHAGQLVRGQLPPLRLQPKAGQGRLAMGYEAGARWWEARQRVRRRSEDWWPFYPGSWWSIEVTLRIGKWAGIATVICGGCTLYF